MRQRTGGRGDRALLVAGTVATFGLHLWLSSGIDAPTVVFDENGYLGNARHLAGGARWDMPFAPSYAVGYAVVISPVMRWFHTPTSQWQALLVVNALLLCTVFPLLTAVLHRVFDVPRRPAMAAALVGAVTPAVVATGISAIAENLVLPLVPLTILALWAMLDDGRRTRSRLWFGVAVAALYATHPRFTSLVVVALGLLAWALLRRRADRRVLTANAVLLVVASAVAKLLNRAVIDARWDRVERLEGGAREWWDLVTSASGLGELFMTAVGQAWYLVIGSMGLVAVGLAVLARRASVRTEDPAPAPGRRVVVTFVLVAAGAVFATSVLFFAQNQFRADHLVYGRHNDSFAPLWVAVALAYLLDRTARRPVALLGGAAALAAVLSAALIANRDPGQYGDVFSPFAVSAIIRYVGHDPGGTLTRASVFGLLGIGLVTGLVALHRADRAPHLARRAAAPVLCVGLAGWFVYAGLGVVRGTEDFGHLIYDRWTPVEVIERLDVQELCIDAAAVRGRATLSYPWALPDVTVRTYDSAAGQQPDCPFTIARLDDEARARAGDRVMGLDQGGMYEEWDAPLGMALWASPRTTGEGVLRSVDPSTPIDPGTEVAPIDRDETLPEGFPTVLPQAARSARITIDGPQRTFTTTPGGRVRIPIQVAHTGSGSPWPDFDSFALEGRVRVAAEITPQDPDGVEGARSGGELPRWMLPGDDVGMTAEVVAVDQTLGGLPPGRYDVQLGVIQEGEDWFASGGEDARFTLVIEP